MPFTINPPSVSNPVILTVGVPFSITFTWVGGIAPYCFIGEPLPNGLSYTPADTNSPLPTPIVGNTLTISGTPTTIQNIFTNTEFDDDNCNGQTSVLIGINFQVNAPTPISKKKNRFMGVPPTICCDPERFPNKVCPPQVAMNGYYYDRIGETNCYILRKRK